MASIFENALSGLPKMVGGAGDSITKGFNDTGESTAFQNMAKAATIATMLYGFGAAGSSMMGGEAAGGEVAGGGAADGLQPFESNPMSGPGGVTNVTSGGSGMSSNPMFKNMASQGLMGMGDMGGGGGGQPQQIDTNEYLRKRQADERSRLMAQALMNRTDSSSDPYLANQQA